jgi:succinate dehydrogenase / fumarate reductase cytochrome b subunit
MNWLFRSFASSIGKKTLMAVTGLSFCAFITVHLFGNLFLYVGRDSFNSYVDHLHALGILVNLAELGLITLAVIHITAAVYLYFDNLAARPVRYEVTARAGGRTWASQLMPYTGLYILLFVLIHLITFKFADHTNRTVYDIVDTAFSNAGYLLFYMFSMVVVAFHISHGLWSACQTLGLNHVKYMPAIQKFGLGFSVAVGVIFGLIPIFMLFT